MHDEDERNRLRLALEEMEAEALDFGTRFVKDGKVRAEYAARISQMSDEVMAAYEAGDITVEEGARMANGMRNQIMDVQRVASSDVGKAVAEKEKLVGKTLPELQNKYAKELFGRSFEELSEAEQGKVFARIIERSGVASARYVKWAARLAKIGRGLEILTIAIAVYNVATADDKIKAAEREGVTAGGGFLGGAAGGALAGLACGPGAPVCVTIGVFVGGALGAFGFSMLFERATRN